ncbi:MAG: DUF2784 domain-containing protein [Pseudomonadota bacterium]
MSFLLAAQVVMLLHYAFLVFATFGGFLLHWWPKLAWLHLPVVTWGVLIAAIGWTCPLTPLENRLRVAGGAAPYQGGFIEHYITAGLYPDGLPSRVLLAMGIALLLINAVAYGLFWWHSRH